MPHHPHSDERHVDVDGSPAVLAGPHPLTMVYGGGGLFGVGWCTGVAHGLADGGVPVATVPALGTSAGAWTAAAVALGTTYEDVVDLDVPRVPNLRPGVLAEVAREVFDEATHPLVSVSAVCVRSRRRHVLDGGRYPLADLVAASSAVPGLLPPHRVDGRLYVDGGMWSTTSVDAAADAHCVVVVAPLAGPHMGMAGRVAGALLERELDTWRRRHPGHRVVLVRPDRASAATAGRGLLSLFEPDRGRAAYPLAVEQGRRWADRVLDALEG